jgi:hypothetical protein
VQHLAARSGVRVAIPTPSSDHKTSHDRLVLVAIAGGLVLLVGVGVGLRRLF